MGTGGNNVFLSIQAQDFIEDGRTRDNQAFNQLFLSIQAQDFIEDCIATLERTVLANS